MPARTASVQASAAAVAVAIGAAVFAFAGCGPSSPTTGAPDADSEEAWRVPPNDAGADSADGEREAAADAGDANANPVDATPPRGDAGADASEASADGGVLDGAVALDGESLDAPEDAPIDASIDTTPNVCGDGVRDPATEECDNGANNVDGVGACSTTCQVQDFLASSSVSSIDAGPLEPYQYPPHRIGLGRHAIAGGPGGFAVAFLEQAGNGDFTLRAEAFEAGGVRVASFPIVGPPSPAMASADPALAAISARTYAAVWKGDTGGAGGPGIAMALLDTSSGAVGSVAHASSVQGPGSAPDALWAGGELVVAWEDDSGESTDLKFATFDAALNALDPESDLAQTAADERDVTLAPFAGSWAAAWRAEENGLATVHVKAGDVEVVTNAAMPGPPGERPALVQIGPTTLFVAFSQTVAEDDAGVVTTTMLVGAVADMSSGGPARVIAHEIPFAAQGDGGDSHFPEGFPALIGVGGDVWLAAWTGGQPGDPLEDEVWLANSANASAAGLGANVVPLPRTEVDRGGVQKTPALAVTELGGAGAVVAAWEDDGWTIGGVEARPDVILEVMPLPMLRRPGGP